MQELLSPQTAALAALRRMLDDRTSTSGLAWLDERCSRVRAGVLPDAFLVAAHGQVPRYLGKAELMPASDDLAAAETVRPGWSPARWSIDQAGRTILVLAAVDGTAFARRIDLLFEAADIGELVALYQGLPLFPDPTHQRAHAAEGVRSNMTSVFESVALDNPFPAEEFDEPAWNQMVLKALFVGSPLHRIRGLDARCNPALAHMAADYAHERWAARRPVPPELWRTLGPFADGVLLDDLARALNDPDPAQHEAAAIALSRSRAPAAGSILTRRRPALRDRITRGDLDWSLFTQQRLSVQPGETGF